METISLHKDKKRKGFSPTRRIALSFFCMILIGSLLLSLPICNQVGHIPFIDHLFVATSATCVTGLVPVVVAEQYTLVGQLIIIILIQVGGLGFLTLLNVMIVVFQKRLSYTNKILMQESLNQNSLKDITVYIKRVITYTFFFECLGALFLSIVFVPEFGWIKGIYYSMFHSISAFCNGGFDILGSSSLIPYQTNIIINFTIAGLIIAGSMGFIVWIDLRYSLHKYKEHFRTFEWKRYLSSLQLHTKIVLIMTIGLLLMGTFVFFLLEHANPETLGSLSFPEKILVSFFQSTTLRTAGFASVNMATLYDPTKFFMCMIMFIGGSPAGTAGGIKTVTFAMMLLYIRALVQGREDIVVMNREISDQVAKRALTIGIVSFGIAMLGLFVLSMSEHQDFINLIFEVFSAFGTVGLTAGLTPLLTNIGKFVIIILMYVGRIGPMTMVLIFAKRYQQMKGKTAQYPQGDVLIG